MAQQQQQNRQQQQPPPHGDRPRGGTDSKAQLQQSNLKTLREMFAKLAKQLEAALPKFITPERMIRVATTTVQRVPRLLECDPVTVVGAIMQSAQLGLEPDNITGMAYLVPFWNTKNDRYECSLIPGYRGLLMLARRSKEIAACDARVVKKGDQFEYEYGTRQYLRHKPATLTADPDKVDTIAAYMIAFYANARGMEGTPASQFHVMQIAELEKAKQFTTSRVRFGPNKGEITGPWVEHPDAMRTKTVIRRGAKLLPFAIELQTAVGLEERAIAGKSQNLGALVADDLGVQFSGTDEEDDQEREAIPTELQAKIDGGFDALGYSEARRTVKLQEYRGKLEDLVGWLEAEMRRAPGQREPEPPTDQAGGPAASPKTETAKTETAAAGKTETKTPAAEPKEPKAGKSETAKASEKPRRSKFMV